MARCELAPGSPWNAIFFGVVMAPSNSNSEFRQYPARSFEILGRVDATRHRVHDGHVDPHAGLDGPELLELFLPLQRGRRQPDKTPQRGAAIGIKADMVIARPVAPRRSSAGKIQR